MNLTDTANAERLLSMYGDEIFYCPQMKTWYRWDGRIWRMDMNNSMLQLAKRVAQSYTMDADTAVDHTQANKLARWASTSSSLQRLKAMIEIAQSEPDICVEVGVLDHNPMLLAVENGVVELDTGKFRKFEPSDFITRIAPVQYRRGAECPIWDKFLTDIQPDPDTRRYIQRAVGYSLTASTKEDKLFILHGDGANGKTTFVNTILALIGGYAAQASSQTLMRKRDTGAKDDLFSLMGKRFVAATETGESHQLDENLVKQMTGGNRISVNPKYRTQMEFTPTWKLWLDTNYEPAITGTDHGIWRRLIKIPFQVTVKQTDIDTKLRDRLMSNLDERSGILNWAVKGAGEWQRHGLCESDEVVGSTSAYRTEQDLIGEFINLECKRSPKLFIEKASLYVMYLSFCRKMHETPRSINAFGRQLHQLGVKERRTGAMRYWVGIDMDKSVVLHPVTPI
ncbi:MAG: phage/plasmid primase, P4 family [Chloroflexota bacterium]|nr:phage/plasmid primase, P4 family [Chloroflexota bacterium]